MKTNLYNQHLTTACVDSLCNWPCRFSLEQNYLLERWANSELALMSCLADISIGTDETASTPELSFLLSKVLPVDWMLLVAVVLAGCRRRNRFNAALYLINFDFWLENSSGIRMGMNPRIRRHLKTWLESMPCLNSRQALTVHFDKMVVMHLKLLFTTQCFSKQSSFGEKEVCWSIALQ